MSILTEYLPVLPYSIYCGNVTVTVRLFPSWEDAAIFPRCASTIAFAMDNPIPCPPVPEFLD